MAGGARSVAGSAVMPPQVAVSRREFMLTAAATAVSGSAAFSAVGTSSSTAARQTDLLELSAVDAVLALTRGEMTAERYAGALLAQCTTGQALNAFITLEPPRVLEAARAADRRRMSGGPTKLLHGLPIAIKDSLNTRDYRTTCGTPALRNFRPKDNAGIVRALLDAGAIVLGKNNLHELSWGWTSNNLAFGAVHNPYDPRRIPGGSSGGTAAAVAARMAPLGVGADTYGSIRVPAAFCGIAGFRPTTGRYSTAGLAPITPLYDTVGPLARTVADLALFDRVASTDSSVIRPMALKGVKLAVDRDYWFAGLDPEVERITGESLRRLEDVGAAIVDAKFPDLPLLIERCTDPVQYHDVRYTLERYLKESGAGLSLNEVIAMSSPDVKELFQHDVLPGGAGIVSDTVYDAARDRYLPQLRAIFRNYFAASGVAAIVFPTTMAPAPFIGQDADIVIRGRKISFETAIGRNIAPGSTTGLPGLVLPSGLTTSGLPVALEFDGRAGTDRALLALGLSLERVLGRIAGPKLSTARRAVPA